MRVLAFLLVFFLTCGVAFAQMPPPWLPEPEIEEPEEEAQDNPPTKGSISKDVHIIFDQSTSVTDAELIAALEQALNIIARGVDEFNLKVTVFGREMSTLNPVGLDVLKSRKDWMSMPSKNNLDVIIPWLIQRRIDGSKTIVTTPMLYALSDNVRNLTVIVIGDMLLSEKVEDVVKEIVKKQEERKKTVGAASIGFINIGGRGSHDAVLVSKFAKKNDWFMINTVPARK